MADWFKIDLGDAMLAHESLLDLKIFLSHIYEVEGSPEGMLAIYRHESAGLHCSVIVYVTTKFQQTAQLKNALTCDAPPLLDSGFLAGDSTLKSESKKES